MYLDRHPYAHLIRRYFPADQWEAAACVSSHECEPLGFGWRACPDCPPSPTPIPYPAKCHDLKTVTGTDGATTSRVWGIFGLAEVAWDPVQNPASPFTPEQWAAVMDPDLNTWMASVIWSGNGWRAWSTCAYCPGPTEPQICQVRGGPVPFPRYPGPVVPEPVEPPAPGGSGVLLVGLAALAVVTGVAVWKGMR